MNTSASQRTMPVGRRKGGTIFPRCTLKDAIAYAKRLVSKTHINGQTRDVIMAGVVQAKGPTGDIKISALKQFGLLKGDNKSLYSATELAKKIVHATDDELPQHLRQAALHPKVFKQIFETYHGDTITKAKLRQRAGDLNIHPEQTGTCIDLYVASLAEAGLVNVNGERVTHVSPEHTSHEEKSETTEVMKDAHDVDDEITNSQQDADSPAPDQDQNTNRLGALLPAPKAVFHVNINLDSSMDIDKLEKQLALLKKFGAI